MRGRLGIGGHHGYELRCMVYFSTYTYICLCSLAISNREKLCSYLELLPWKKKLKKSSFQGIYDLTTLKLNIQWSKAIKVNRVLFM